MASGKITGGRYNSYYWLELEWDSTANDSNNTSTVNVEVWLCSTTYGSINYTATKSGNTTVNGSSSNFSSTTDVNIGEGGGRVRVYTRSGVSVTHNSDGSKSITISAWFEPDVNISGSNTGRWSVSGTAKLDTINRGVINVYNGGWKEGTMYVYNGGWKKAKAVYVYNGGWKRST